MPHCHLAGAESEGTALLDVLGDCSSRGQLRISGQLSMNGSVVLPGRLAERLTYVQRDGAFCGQMSVRQTLLFHAFLQEPGHVARCFNTKNKVNAGPGIRGIFGAKWLPHCLRVTVPFYIICFNNDNYRIFNNIFPVN